jgi:hypothetical protein
MSYDKRFSYMFTFEAVECLPARVMSAASADV